MNEKYEALLLDYLNLKEQYEIQSVYVKELELAVDLYEEKIKRNEYLQS